MSRLTIEIPDEMHKQIKALAALNGQNIKEFVLSRLTGKSAQAAKPSTKVKKPSKQLLAALEEARHPEKLRAFKTTDELFATWRKELGLKPKGNATLKFPVLT